ncbi:acyl-CoA thioester hydrolase/BAAT C-terminal domain-containing protein [Gordonia sp. NPDC003950]
MGFLIGFSPWIVYWILVGNMPFRGAVLIALGLSALAVVINRALRRPWHSLEVGAVAVFVVLSALSFSVSDAFLERWLQPLGNAGIFLVALVGLLVRRPFVREYATASVDAATAATDGFRVITTAMTWMWTAVFGLMTVASLIPPIVQGDATIRDGGSTLSIICYWVLPFTLMGIAGTASGVFPAWFDKKSAQMARRDASLAPGSPVPQPPAQAASIDPRLGVDVPLDSRHDEPLTITLESTGETVDVTTTATDLYGGLWRWSTRADGSAQVTNVPIWAMEFDGPADHADLFIPPTEPWLVRVEARAGDRRTALTCRRHPVAAGVEVTDVLVDGRPGLLATPASAIGPAVVCFGGSEGGVDSQRAMIGALASRGHTALAYGWLDDDPEAAPVSEIPLERFASAIAWLCARSGSSVAAVGLSRGAEGLTATLSHRADLGVSHVILLSPSSVIWQAIGPDGEIPGTSSWTLDAWPSPFAALPTGALMPQLVGNAWRLSRDIGAGRPTVLRLHPAYDEGLRRSIAPEAQLASERITCPILCISGSDDALWPSERMADALLGRRNTSSDKHIRYEGAGHFLRPGLFPTTVQLAGGIDLGGRAAEHASACLALTDDIVTFIAG